MSCSRVHHKNGFVPFIILPILLAFILLFNEVASAQNSDVQKVVLFKDGTTSTGKIVEMNIYTIKIQAADGSTVTRKFDDVVSIDKKEIAVPKKLLPVHSIDVGLEAFYKKYEEPDVMNNKGMMYGAALGYTYHDNVMAKAQLLIAYGEVNYDSNRTGSINSIPDNHWEIRGLLGYDFAVDPTFYITPYIGLGYRYLGDDSSGKISTTGHSGYKRESNYYYSPVGIELIKILQEGWTIAANAEFDYLWYGKQKSYPAGIEINNQQNQGYGIRTSLKVEKKITNAAIVFEPFIRYWDIGQSEIDFIFVEPKNKTTEYGALIGLKF